MATMSTIRSTGPRKGFMSCASCVMLVEFRKCNIIWIEKRTHSSTKGIRQTR
jgi:hypothetical protein